MPTFGTSGQNQQANSNVVANPKPASEPQVKGPQMNDRDFTNDILATEKYLTDNLNLFAQESSNQALYDQVAQILQETQNTGRNLFNLMFKKGWYKLTAAQAQDIQQKYQQFQGYQSQFPY